MKARFAYEPSVLIGVLLTVIAGVGQAIDAQQGGPFNPWRFAVAVLPLVAGLAIRFNVISVAKVADIVSKADSIDVAVHEIANQVGVHPPQD